MRTEYCGLVNERYVGRDVTLYGWVHRRRDHGGVIFIDLRDREGIVQVVCDPDRAARCSSTAEALRSEFCVQIDGLVRPRPQGTANAGLTSGEIEVLCRDLVVLNPSVPPPFQLDDDDLSETTRLTHRVLDLRRPAMQNNLRLRYRVAMDVRHYLDAKGFIDIETPMLTKSTPEGARDYLVPSRVHEGMFFALPQSPQLFKQLLMVAGFDRYYQIVKCFRDEDLRADRQPEFTQIDIETSFLDEEEIRDLMEVMIRDVFQEVDRRRAARSVPGHALRRGDAPLYGSDKPDLRVKLRVHRAHRRHGRRRFQGLPRRHRAQGRPRRRAARARRRRHGRVPRSTPTPSSSASTAPRGWPRSRSTSARRAATACSRRSSRTCTTPRWRRSSSAPARATAT